MRTARGLFVASCVLGLLWLWLWYRLSRVTYDIAGKTHKGGREENQDLLGGKGEGLPQTTMMGDEWAFHRKSGRFCFVVADGLGGHSGGEHAAQLAVTTILDYFQDLKRLNKENVSQEMQQAILQAHQRIREQAQANPALEDMKATCVVLLLIGNRAYWSNIGDSRLYLFRNGQILHKTKDHSVVQVLLDMKDIEERDVRGHPDRNRVLKSLGMAETPRPEIHTETLKKHDYLLLCTDGLWEYALDEELEHLIQKSSGAIEHTLRNVFQHAENTALKTTTSARDNITLLLIGVR